VNCIPGEIIIKNLMLILLELFREKDNKEYLREEIIYWSAYHENKM
jgi:hypothetical protein